MLPRRAGALLLFLSLAGARLEAQGSRWTLPVVDSVPTIGSLVEDRHRLAQLLGRAPTDGWLVRALSSRLGPPASGDSLAWAVLTPELFVVHNSELPFSQNDGALWAGRGRSVRLRGGFTAAVGPLRVVLMPELATSENRHFDAVDSTRWHRPFLDFRERSPYASPWNQHPVSADVPVRFGVDRYKTSSLGQSALWVESGPVAAGLATENLWWGPGVHDALIMTNNAAGVPHAFVRTARPVRTGVGDFEGRLILGTLRESDYFDHVTENDARSLSAAAVTYRPRWQPTLTVGLARAVYAPVSGTAGVVGRLFDVFGAHDRPGARPWSDSTFTGGREQLTSLFARWIFPAAGWEFYGEYGRAERPASVRDFLADPGHTRGVIVGAQFARRTVGDAVFRLQVEGAQLEQSTSYRYRPTQSWYTSRAMPQGYTQRGQVVGATIGPGSAHLWLAGDHVAPSWSAGAFFGWWRFNTDAMYASIQFPPGTGWCEFDTTLYPGARGAYRNRWIGTIQAELVLATRLNAFHQNNSGCPAPEQGRHLRDVRNRTIRVTFTPRLPR